MPTVKTAPARSKAVAVVPKKEPVTPSWVGRVPLLKPGQYSDGMPIHHVEYLCCKLLLRPNRFISRQSLFDFGKVMRGPAKQNGVGFSVAGFDSQPVKIREVLFIDTDDFRLYNNAFILRRRIPYKDGFPIGDPEVVFKFRHPDMQVAAETDMRPHILGDHQVKFKCQALPLKEKQIQQSKLEAEARKEATVKNAEAMAEAKVIDSKAELERRKMMTEGEADRIRHVAAADSERLRMEADVLKQSPLLIQKIIAEKLSDKVQIMMVPNDGKFFFANDVLKGATTVRTTE